MPRLIQSPARGVLALLTSKDGGLGPPAMEDYLRLTLETRDFYSVNARRDLKLSKTPALLDAVPDGFIAAGGAATNVGWYPTIAASGPAAAVQQIFVPEGELWRVLGVTMRFTHVTGGLYNMAAGWAFGSFDSWHFAQIGTGSAVTTSAGHAAQAGGLCDFLATPGSAPAFFTPFWDLGVFDFNLFASVVFERYPL